MRAVPNRKQRVVFWVPRDVHRDKVGTGNRWDSGYPFGLGGAAPMDGAVFTQYDTVPPIKDVYLVMKVLQRNAREAAARTATPPRIYRPVHMGPVVGGRRAVAPNVPAKDEASE
ncbi:hypothetical protein [Micrococcus sp.]|uniref:hypothetical protein n=1 Tax=Micrococcus sp. TaxID=1271 RepID=UPI002A9116A0|nr:hypothetical protein [Micrococcus sp.]MDY6055172.1 hypothetical protein [Micrococcus sp.]